jgi:hypothetical protein
MLDAQHHSHVVKDVLQVISPTGGYFAVISLVDVRESIQIVALLVTIVCTILVTCRKLRPPSRRNRKPDQP